MFLLNSALANLAFLIASSSAPASAIALSSSACLASFSCSRRSISAFISLRLVASASSCVPISADILVAFSFSACTSSSVTSGTLFFNSSAVSAVSSVLPICLLADSTIDCRSSAGMFSDIHFWLSSCVRGLPSLSYWAQRIILSCCDIFSFSTGSLMASQDFAIPANTFGLLIPSLRIALFSSSDFFNSSFSLSSTLPFLVFSNSLRSLTISISCFTLSSSFLRRFSGRSPIMQVASKPPMPAPMPAPPPFAPSGRAWAQNHAHIPTAIKVANICQLYLFE